jgi:hypothetical protein
MAIYSLALTETQQRPSIIGGLESGGAMLRNSHQLRSLFGDRHGHVFFFFVSIFSFSSFFYDEHGRVCWC